MKAYGTIIDADVKANPRALTCFVLCERKDGTAEVPVSDSVIKSVKIESTGVQGKLFGTTYCQKLTCVLKDPKKLINEEQLYNTYIWFVPTKYADNYFDARYTAVYPHYFVDSTLRDEKTGDLTVIGYDYMGKAANTLFSLDADKDSFTIIDLINRCKYLMGVDGGNHGIMQTPFLPTQWTREQINLSGEETVRDMLNAIAEVRGEFCYQNTKIDGSYFSSRIEFTPIFNTATHNGSGWYHNKVEIDKSRYFELTSDKPYKLTGITATNELNDSVSVGTDEYRQVIYNNPLLTLLPDETQQTILTGILNKLKDISITPFNCEWRGDPRLEPTDWLEFEDKNGNKFQSFLLNETVEYNGGFKSTMWVDKMESQTPIAADRNISTSILKTKATVDKVKGEITLEVSRAKEAEQLLGSRITINENAITSEVKNRQDADNELSSTITQTANSITSEVSRATGKENELAADISTITQTVDNISTRIDTVEGNYSTINQTVNEISLEVGNKADANGGALISLINADTSTAKISADKITLEGEVSFVKKGDNVSELANDKGYLVGDDLGATGTTVIDGGRITTGIISANRLDLSGTLTVGSNISQLTNDTGYITTGDIPTKTSDLINDSGFIDSLDTADFAKLSQLKNADYTVINGGNITTGTIQAGVIFAGSLNGVEGNFTNLTTNGTISNGSNGFYITWYGSSGNAFVGYSTGGTGFAGLQFVPSLDQIYMIGGGNSILFNGSGTSYINLGSSSYISADRFITKNYGSSLPSSGSTGEVFYKVVN